MLVWLNSILRGVEIYKEIAIFFFVGTIVFSLLGKEKINPIKGVLDQLFILYLCCVAALVFLPLPTMEEAMGLVYKIQLIPGRFIFNAIEENTCHSIYSFVLNIIMTIPLGMYLYYRRGVEKRSILIASLIFTIFIEIGQLTGLFFVYPGSYRLCDIDDVFSNTLGGMVGYYIMRDFKQVIPSIEFFDVYAGMEKEGKHKIVKKEHLSN